MYSYRDILFVIFTAPVPTFGSCCFIRVKSPSLHWVLSSVLKKLVQNMLGKFDAFVHQGSGWAVTEVKVFSLNFNEFTLFSGGGGCSSLPLRIKRSHSCILIGNSCDDKCFLKCIVVALCDKRKNMGQWCGEYEKIMKGIEELSLGFLTFPTTLKVIKKFEQKWPVSINVYGYSGVIYPHYLSRTLLQSDRRVVNLLLHSRHYFLIRNMSALVTPQCKTNKQKCHVCPSSLSFFFTRTGMKLIFISARKMGLPEFSPRGMKLSWVFFFQQYCQCALCNLRRFGNNDLQRGDGQKR